VADAVGLHPTRFHERFLIEIGQTPAEWRIRRRIALAQERLRVPDASVTEVAFALGFASSQYFATAFKKYTGRTPTEYRHAVIDVAARPDTAGLGQ
jgi:AraC-like DNA-binding protein